jgi:SIR2-like domain
MLMVIFGAGASYDSIPTYPPMPGEPWPISEYRLPLADHLFANRPLFADVLAMFPRCHAVVPRLRDLRGRLLEQELEQLQGEAEEYPTTYKQLAAIRYYLHEVLWQCENKWKEHAKGITNYKSLLNRIERWRGKSDNIFLVTFNYDTLLEDALSQELGMNVQSLDDYMTHHEHYKVFKLHGSVNWAREIEPPITDFAPKNPWPLIYELIEGAADVKLSQRYKLAKEHPVTFVDGKAAFPAIAIPVQSKLQFECPLDHLEQLRASLSQVRKILVIGWRATEAHFLGILKAGLCSPLNLAVVCGSKQNAEQVGARLKTMTNAAGIPANLYLSQAGFTDFIVSGDVDQVLGR